MRRGRTVLCAGLVVALAAVCGGAMAQPPAPGALDLGRMLAADPEARKIRVVLTPGITSNRDLTDPVLQAARKRMFQGGAVSPRALQALADLGDGNAALRLIKRLEAAGADTPPATIAHYYGIAAATGRVSGLNGLVRTLRDLDPTTTSAARLAVLRDIVVAYAAAGNSTAAAAVVEFAAAGRPFGPMDDAIQDLADRGNPLIALNRANALIQGGWDTADDLTRAQSYLKAVSQTAPVRAQTFARTMIPVLDARIAVLTAPRATQETDR
ncbi:hypothetical protein DXV76_15130 [Rhodobacteraceae bacterium CCMM004]|nr:hypothetical protein DXV76_15130 [Rhodobacteraceae bacterium CCMM004]